MLGRWKNACIICAKPDSEELDTRRLFIPPWEYLARVQEENSTDRTHFRTCSNTGNAQSVL